MGGKRSCLTFWACSDAQREINLPSGEGWGGPILPHSSLSLHCPSLFLRPPGWGLQCIPLFSSVSAAGAITGCVCQSWLILHWEGKNIHCKPHPEHHWSGRTTPRNQASEWFIRGSFDPCQGRIKHLLSFCLTVRSLERLDTLIYVFPIFFAIIWATVREFQSLQMCWAKLRGKEMQKGGVSQTKWFLTILVRIIYLWVWCGESAGPSSAMELHIDKFWLISIKNKIVLIWGRH